MVEPVFNDIIPRTRAQRVSTTSLLMQWSRAIGFAIERESELIKQICMFAGGNERQRAH